MTITMVSQTPNNVPEGAPDAMKERWQVEERVRVALSEVDAIKRQITDWNHRGRDATEDCIAVKAQFYYDRCIALAADVKAVSDAARRLGLDGPLMKELAGGAEYLRIQTIFTPEQLRAALAQARNGQSRPIEDVRREIRDRAH